MMKQLTLKWEFDLIIELTSEDLEALSKSKDSQQEHCERQHLEGIKKNKNKWYIIV